MTRLEMIQELASFQSELISQYASLMKEKEAVLSRFGQLKNELNNFAQADQSHPNSFADAIIDLPNALRNYDLEKEMVSVTKKLSAMLYGLSRD